MMDSNSDSESSALIEFKAGKMNYSGSQVSPDSRKGLVRIARGEEGLLHFQWLDRTTQLLEDDQIIFPDEAVFEKVTQSPGRVYILKFNTDDRKFFFWMQDPNPQLDSQFCISVNYHLNRPLDWGAQEQLETSIPEDIIDDDDDNDNDDDDGHISSRAAGNLIVPNLGGGEVSSDVSSSSSGAVKLSDLQRILSNIGSADGGGDPDGGLGLDDILKPELILPLLETLSLEQELVSYLPEGQWSPEDILELLQSPPFRQQVDSFTYVLRTGQIDLSQFGVDPSKYKFTVLSFLEALEDSVATTTESRQAENDLRSQTCNRNEPMDES